MPGRITVWQSDVSGSIHFLHQLFPDINTKSKIVVESNRNWGDSPQGTGSFTVYVCEPDSPTRSEESHRDSIASYNIQCSVLDVSADFLMGGSQLGPVPVWILTRRPAMEKRWNEMAALLIAHPEWSKAQVEDSMRTSGVKYGADSHDKVLGPILDSLNKLEPFLGRLTIESMDYAPPRLTDTKELLPPAWIVNVRQTIKDARKPATTYALTFSVFDGAFESEQKFIAGHPKSN